MIIRLGKILFKSVAIGSKLFLNGLIIFIDLYAKDRGNDNVTGITLIFLSLENKGNNHTKGSNQGRGNDHFYIEGRSNFV